jgi:hypothetical protein
MSHDKAGPLSADQAGRYGAPPQGAKLGAVHRAFRARWAVLCDYYRQDDSPLTKFARRIVLDRTVFATP